MTVRRKILIITLEPIAKQMAGPAIRAVELGKQLADEFDVILFSPRPTDLERIEHNGHSLELLAGIGKGKLYKIAQDADVIFVQANVLKSYPHLADLDKPIVVDLYDPYLLSILAEYANDPVTASSSYRLMHQVLKKHMLRADFCLCASERQRDYWLGRFCELGRMTPEMYKFDGSFRKLIDVVPFGLPASPAKKTGPGIKGHVPGIEENDFVLVWGGGIWQWFDPLTVIKAVAELSKTKKNLKLYFMGIKSPNPQVAQMPIVTEAKKLAADLNVLDKHVFFGESWISYADRVNYLLDADVAVSAHYDLPETRFSFRTRILDYLWADLPILTTGGDQLADLISENSAGMALPYKDVQAWQKAIESLMLDSSLREKCSQGAKHLAQNFVWDKAVQPLKEFCRKPYRLPVYKKIKVPSVIERAQAVYSRGGKDLLLKRSKNALNELLKR